jgi:hypothetical protein
MSYILFASSGSSPALPLSVANGGTGADTEKGAVINLTSPAFSNSASSPDWGNIPVTAPVAPDPNELFNSLSELLAALQQVSIIQVA